MEKWDPNLQGCGSFGDKEEYMAYSGAVHKLIVLFNGGLLGFLQIRNQTKSVFDTNLPNIICFWVFVLIYAILRVSEIVFPVHKLRKFFGHLSHLFGVSATLALVTVMSLSFALSLLPLSLLWFSFVTYKELILHTQNSPSV